MFVASTLSAVWSYLLVAIVNVQHLSIRTPYRSLFPHFSLIVTLLHVQRTSREWLIMLKKPRAKFKLCAFFEKNFAEQRCLPCNAEVCLLKSRYVCVSCALKCTFKHDIDLFWRYITSKNACFAALFRSRKNMSMFAYIQSNICYWQ